MSRKEPDDFQKTTVRFPKTMLEKIGWLAEHRGCTKTEAIRQQMAIATHGIERPKPLKSREIRPSEQDWEKLQQMANKLNVEIPELFSWCVDKLAAKVLADDPSCKK